MNAFTSSRSDQYSWDNAYSRELINHEDDADDEGTVWFSESNAESAISKVLGKLASKGLLDRGARDPSTEQSTPRSGARFLDLGTGNGHLLHHLQEEDDDDEIWAGEMVGVDYSETSVDLARRIAQQKGASSISFELWDLLAEAPGDWLKTGFDVVLDKGTFDAISLMESVEGAGHPCEVYRDKVVPLVKYGGFLVVTSCNWTKTELLEWLACEQLRFYDEATYRTFTFGGQTGQSIVTLVFKRD